MYTTSLALLSVSHADQNIGYYLRLFPEAQQKTASGFLTALWQHEPFRNRWTLIAKVYSFIRDEVGKQKVSLPYFLGICCPIMKIISPISYLHFFGWTVEGNEKEGQKLVRQWTPTDTQIEGIQSQSYPNTEIDLLRTMLSLGYLPEESMLLMERMRSNSNGVMDTGSGSSRFPVPFNAQKMDYINTVREDPIQAAQELFGIHYNDASVRVDGYRVYDAENLDDINHLSMLIPPASPTSLYHYTGTYAHLGYSGDPTMRFFQQPEHQNLSVRNPIQMESFIGHPAEEGDRSKSPRLCFPRLSLQLSPHLRARAPGRAAGQSLALCWCALPSGPRHAPSPLAQPFCLSASPPLLHAVLLSPRGPELFRANAILISLLAAGLPDGPEYNPEHDFHYMY
jgi:hypothetical protein